MRRRSLNGLVLFMRSWKMHLLFASTTTFCVLQLVLGNPLQSRIDTAYDGKLEQESAVAKRGTTMFEFMCEVFGELDDLKDRVKALEEGNKLESCPDGWYKHENSCYFFSSYGLNWIDSLVFCMGFQGYLAEINDAGENAYLKNKVGQLAGQFWVGATDLIKENHWIWVTSQNRLTTSVFLDWARNEPNNEGEEHCLELQAGGWNDKICTKSQGFICERGLKSDK